MGTAGTNTFARMPRGVILVVDDYADSRLAVRQLLEDHGYQVVEAANGQEAVNVLAAGAPRVQLVILDLQMPIMTGWQLLTVLDSYIRLSAIPVVVVSAHPSLPNQGRYKSIVGCLKLPYRSEELLALVQACCSPSSAPSPTGVVAKSGLDPTPKAAGDVESSPAIDLTQK